MGISMPVYTPGTGNLVGMRKGGKVVTSGSAVSQQRKRMREQANRMAVQRASNRKSYR